MTGLDSSAWTSSMRSSGFSDEAGFKLDGIVAYVHYRQLLVEDPTTGTLYER